jgi:hypothetical protein
VPAQRGRKSTLRRPKPTQAGKFIKKISDFLWVGKLPAGNTDRQQVNLAVRNGSAPKPGALKAPDPAMIMGIARENFGKEQSNQRLAEK